MLRPLDRRAHATAALLSAGVAVAAIEVGCSGGGDASTTTFGAGGSLSVVASSSVAASSTFATTVGVGGAPPTFGCNPLTNQGCDEGETCDAEHGELAFVCYAGESTLAICASCGPDKGYCKAGATCFQGLCQKYCCTDSDCSSAARCDKGILSSFGMGEVGVCRIVHSTEAGGGGAGGAGGGAPPPPEPDCSAPAASPSQGDCVPSGPT